MDSATNVANTISGADTGIDVIDNIRWQWERIEGLSAVEWHHVVSLRQAVFVVEQNCVYLDADDLDLSSWHLIGWDYNQNAVAYLRVVDAGIKYQELSIGRLLTRISHRNQGIGHALMKKVMQLMSKQFSRWGVRISAQEHLQAFYRQYGFDPVGDVYDEDGIPHVEMVNLTKRVNHKG